MENPHVVPAKKPSKKNLAIITGVLIALLVCFLVSFLIILMNSNSPSEDVAEIVDETDTSEVPPVAATMYEFSGDYITATLPTGWTIEEYSDETGMHDYVDTGSVTFGGLTGLEIFDENRDMLFYLKGIDGIGGGGGCSDIGVFEDTEQTYVDQVRAETLEMGFEPTVVVDLTEKERSEIFSMGERFRRVNHQLYTPKTDNQTVFNTMCGIEAQFIVIEELGFEINDGENQYSANAYSFGLTELPTNDAVFAELDEVLNSIIVK